MIIFIMRFPVCRRGRHLTFENYKYKQMKISGFTMAKNADKLYYPIKAAIESILPIVDEFIVALGDCDADDLTKDEILSINSDKVKIIDTVWDLNKYPKGMENAHQTDIAKEHCTGDWLFYLQADEVVHEKYLPIIRNRCEELLEHHDVEGLLFNYIHFWGDYWHYHNSHGWYRKEIRIIRNRNDIHSWESAQSFRRIPDFDGIHYRQQQNTFKLQVAQVEAYIYHYGWVRPPKLMKSKTRALATIHKGMSRVAQMEKERKFEFDYGPLQLLPEFTESHPKVMDEWINKYDWKGELQFTGKPNSNRPPNRHERFKNRVVTFIENVILGGKTIAEFKNYILLNK